MKTTAEHEAVARALYLADVEPEMDNWDEIESGHSGEHYRWLAEAALDAIGRAPFSAFATGGTVTGAARLSAEIEQIKSDPHAYFSGLPRPPRLSSGGRNDAGT